MAATTEPGLISVGLVAVDPRLMLMDIAISREPSLRKGNSVTSEVGAPRTFVQTAVSINLGLDADLCC